MLQQLATEDQFPSRNAFGRRVARASTSPGIAIPGVPHPFALFAKGWVSLMLPLRSVPSRDAFGRRAQAHRHLPQDLLVVRGGCPFYMNTSALHSGFLRQPFELSL